MTVLWNSLLDIVIHFFFFLNTRICYHAHINPQIAKTIHVKSFFPIDHVNSPMLFTISVPKNTVCANRPLSRTIHRQFHMSIWHLLFWIKIEAYLVNTGTNQRFGLLPNTSLKFLKAPIEKPFLSAPPRNIGALNASEIIIFITITFNQRMSLRPARYRRVKGIGRKHL